MKKITTVPPSKTPVTVTIDIPDPVPTLKGNVIGFTQGDPTITQTGGTPIDPVPVPSPDSQSIIFQMQDNDYARPGAGTKNFFSGNGMQTPLPFGYLDNDQRFPWSQLQTGATTFNWKPLDDAIKKCINAGQKLTFRIVTCDSDVNSPKQYPDFVGTSRVPAFNSEVYLSNFETFITELGKHLYSTGLIKGVYKVDIGGIGNWSEMHGFVLPAGSDWPMKAPSIKRIVDVTQLSLFDVWLMITISGLTANSGLSDEASYYLLMAENKRGKVGIRTDHFGDAGNLKYDTVDISRKYNGVDFKTEILSRWKTSPMDGELMNDINKINASNPYSDLINEINVFHTSQFSNNNWCRNTNSKANATQIAASDKNIIAASKVAGARIGITSAVISNGKLTLKWINLGIAPVYEDWEVWLVLNGVQVKSDIGTLRGLLPGTGESSDILPTGATSISVIIKDPDGYRSPYPLMNTGRQADGSYKIL